MQIEKEDERRKKMGKRENGKERKWER